MNNTNLNNQTEGLVYTHKFSLWCEKRRILLGAKLVLNEMLAGSHHLLGQVHLCDMIKRDWRYHWQNKTKRSITTKFNLSKIPQCAPISQKGPNKILIHTIHKHPFSPWEKQSTAVVKRSLDVKTHILKFNTGQSVVVTNMTIHTTLWTTPQSLTTFI